jgi:hypothetical protein
MPNTASKIMIVRHAEKPAASGTPYGININGQQDPESLIPLGWQRAGALASFFAPSNGQPTAAGIVTPQTLFAAEIAKHSHSERPDETLTPLSQKMNAAIQTPFPKEQFASVVTAALQSSGTVLIAWQHQDIPAMANQILGNSTTAPQKWPGNRFDLVWVFDLNATTGTYTFSQVPQLLLGGDSRKPIA